MKFVVCPHACCCPPSPLFPACSFCLPAPSEIAGKAPHTPQLDSAHRSHWRKMFELYTWSHGEKNSKNNNTKKRRRKRRQERKSKERCKEHENGQKKGEKKEEPEQAPTVIYHFALRGRHHKINEKEELLCFQELRHQMLRLEMGYGQPALAQENRESFVNSTNPEEIEKRSAFEAFLFCSF